MRLDLACKTISTVLSKIAPGLPVPRYVPSRSDLDTIVITVLAWTRCPLVIRLEDGKLTVRDSEFPTILFESEEPVFTAYWIAGYLAGAETSR